MRKIHAIGTAAAIALLLLTVACGGNQKASSTTGKTSTLSANLG